VEKDGTFYITKDATYKWNLLPPFLFNEPDTGVTKIAPHRGVEVLLFDKH
jgi:hypothetical protein